MNPKEFFYLLVTVLFRLAAAYVLLHGLYNWLFEWIGVPGSGFAALGIWQVLIAILVAIILWLLSRPAADLIVGRLEPKR